jgi:Tol biopolymer transport system component
VYLAVRQRQASRAAGTAAAPIHRQATFGGREGTPAISPDGRRIAYVATDTNRRRIVVQDLPDGRAATLLTTTEAGNLRWSPDGSQILFTGRDDDPGGLYVLSRLGGGARRVFSGQFVACWSPDGKTIAVAQYGAGRIVFVDSAGRPAGGVTLARVERWISDLDWSPATNRLLVVANDLRGRHTIWTIGRDGNDQREIVSEPGEIESARWAPNGRAIYYFRRVGQTVSLVSAPVLPGAGGTTQSVLLTGLETDGGFSISSDGERLVYARSPYFSNLHLVDLSESAARGSIVARQITNGTSLVERPRVSPDGTQILFNAGHQPLANLYVMPIAGGEPRQLTFFRAFSVGGVWSPDGKSVAFASTQGGTPRVWMMSADGDNPHPISSGDLSDSYDVLWAPAPRILYQQAGNRNYYVLDPPTGREQPLMSDASLGWVFTPTYSPDLTKLAFAWSRRSQFGLWIADTRTTTQKLAYGASIPTPLGWSPDGAWVYAFEGTRAAYRGLSTALGETMTQVRVMRLSEDGRVETVFALPFEEVGGIAMSRDGRVLVCVVYSSRSDVWVVEHFDAAHSPA